MQKNSKLLKHLMLAMMVAMGVVISPILRVEGMCPMSSVINIVCAVILGPWYALLCAVMIGIIRMVLMGIPPLALTGAVFGAFLAGMLYKLSNGKIIFAVIGESIGTGIIGALVSYPVMTFLWGKAGLTWLFYMPLFFAATIIGGTIAFIFLGVLSKGGMLVKFQKSLGVKVYDKTTNRQILGIRQSIKINKPLIHYITNPISINDCANVILAVGAKPIMAEHPLEVAEITAASKVLAVNLGNITDVRMNSMLISGKTAYNNGLPQIIDVVGVGCSKLRYDYARKYIAECHPSIIKGNMSEIKAMCRIESNAKGIDAGENDTVTKQNLNENIEILRNFSKQTNSVIAVTGAVDIITDGTNTFLVNNGCEMLSMVTGTGCMLTALIAAFISSKDILEGTVLAAVTMGICGELSQNVKGTGSFRTELIDNIFCISDDIIKKRIACEVQ